jgi:hypothetical protein
MQTPGKLNVRRVTAAGASPRREKDLRSDMRGNIPRAGRDAVPGLQFLIRAGGVRSAAC